MGEGRRKRGELTPEQEQERFSTGGLSFEESLRRVLTAGPDDHHSEASEDQIEEARTTMGTACEELTELATVDDDSEILDRLARFEQSLIDGSIENLGSVREQLSEYIHRRGL